MSVFMCVLGNPACLQHAFCALFDFIWDVYRSHNSFGLEGIDLFSSIFYSVPDVQTHRYSNEDLYCLYKSNYKNEGRALTYI